MLILRYALATLFAVLAATGSLQAGTFAEFRPLGFSADGKVFAFEEFGIQDGSGFPFANRFFIDTANDSFLPGATIRVVIEDETAGLAAARSQAAEQSAALEDQYDFSGNPGIIAAFNPLSERDAAAHLLRYEPFSMVPQPLGPTTARLIEKPLAPSDLCAAVTPEAVGFRLDLSEHNGQSVSIQLHDDKSVPKSRGCPTAYRLGGAVTHYADGVWTHVILVLIRSFGFEGEDGRWIAVTRRFE
ncbi:DUF2259 domain-containing protein [uncultured Hoeflea sp.]|uniref:DUF2259 domain-containing protein n=1 Tax=uncultured Hoeflea sp. TaxID=538666 RepID=UPI00260AE9F1|nr:DUF2259 domain-containing protein [uncultured Hoeflea sp.]